MLRAADSPRADIRLRIALHEAELRANQSDDDLLRVHAALASEYEKLGDFGNALRHGQRELTLREHLQGSEHLLTLAARANIAHWTGEAGDRSRARDMCAELLPVVERVLGPNYQGTLRLRNNLALWTGWAGDPAAARKQFAALLSDRERLSGPLHEDTLESRNNLALWTGRAGDPAKARRQLTALLRDEEQALPPDYPLILITRGNLASFAANPNKARRQYAALLPDMERVFGPDHPNTQTVRNLLEHLTRIVNVQVGPGLLTWSENWCEVCGLEEPQDEARPSRFPCSQP